MLELGSSGSVRGVLSNEHPYRHPRSTATQTFFKPATFPLGGERSFSLVACAEFAFAAVPTAGPDFGTLSPRP
jgi:hypothetical protein